MCLEPAADDSVNVLVPRAVSDERFYRSRRRHEQGRRQEPCHTPYHPRAGLSNTFACLPAVLLRPTIQKREQQKRFPRLMDNDYAAAPIVSYM
jgi:hypothetical protein